MTDLAAVLGDIIEIAIPTDPHNRKITIAPSIFAWAR